MDYSTQIYFSILKKSKSLRVNFDKSVSFFLASTSRSYSDPFKS